MLSALAALTPSLVVGGAFLIGVVMFLRRQFGPAGAGDDDDDGEIPDERGNADPADQAASPSADQRKA